MEMSRKLKPRVYFHTYEYLAARLCQAREEQGLSFHELAARASVAPEIVRDLESGRVRVPIISMQKILEAAGFDPIALPGPLREERPQGTYTLEEAVERLDA